VLVLAALCVASSGCTVVKPIVCSFSYPVVNIEQRLDAPDEPDPDEHEQLPPVLVIAAAPVLIPLRFASDAVIGAVGGLFSGFASDLNVITGNYSQVTRNMTQPFRTNARAPE
jgi:hypothetical protein